MQAAPAPTASVLLRSLSVCVTILATLPAQVHYKDDGQPWKQRARTGPDSEVDGWYYNLGPTGLRVQLMADAPTHLLVKHVFAQSPAHGKVKVGDVITGIDQRPFNTEHRNGYGEKVFGPTGPILDFAKALEATQGNKGRGRLKLDLRRGKRKVVASIRVRDETGNYSGTYPARCKRSTRTLKRLLAYLEKRQKPNGSWGSPSFDTFAALAMLASDDPRYLKLVKRNVKRHAQTTSANDRSSLINWRYVAAAIVMSEYYLRTRESWVKPELQEVYDFLCYSQYTDTSQVHEKARRDRPEDLPRKPKSHHGGWGHNPGFEGYGPISMVTGQGALALALMAHCGINVDRRRLDAAYDFLHRGTGTNGYLWYADSVARARGWADMGRTGASAVAHFVSPYREAKYRQMALRQARVIGEHPDSFPDTHGSPIMGMGYTALAAHVDRASFRRLMDANRWWFVLSECADGTFYYQPNRDNAGYGGDSRLSASAVTAFIFSIPRKKLHVTGKPFGKR